MPFRCLDCGTEYVAWTGFCAGCFSAGGLVPAGRRPRAAISGRAAVASAATLAAGASSRVASAAYPALRWSPRSLVVLHGPPGNGKSTLAVSWLGAFDGPVAFWSAEMGVGPLFGELLARCGVRRSDFFAQAEGSLDDFAELLRARRCRAAAVDSVQRALLAPADLRDLLRAAPQLEVLLAISQNNKAGGVRGSLGLEHEADEVLCVERLRWTVTKSRTTPSGLNGDVVLFSDEEPQSFANNVVPLRRKGG